MIEVWRQWYPKKVWRARKGEVRYIVLHHTASSTIYPPEAIRLWHEKGRGWPHVGYHYLVYENGEVYKTLPLEAVPICVRDANPHSICIALVGDFTHNVVWSPFCRGFRALAALVRELKAAYPNARLVHHKDLVQTGCPGRITWGEALAYGGMEAV